MTSKTKTKMAVGDLESQEWGSGARASSGKPRWQLMPLYQIAYLMQRDAWVKDPSEIGVHITLPCLVQQISNFQKSGEISYAYGLLKYSLMYLAEDLDTDFTGACEEVICVWEYGEQKYTQFNWMKGMPWSEVIGCYMRHIQWLLKGETIDQESGRHHAAHLVCNAMMLVHYVEHYPEGNDLPVKWFK